MQTIDILGIAAHPDDVELSCAGTMLLAKRDGKRTGILDLTYAELSSRGTVESRKKETDDASTILGLDWRGNLGLPDGNIELTKENVYKFVKVLRELRPTILLTPHHSERHPDHEAASELAKRASFYAGLRKIETKSNDGSSQEPYRPLLVLQYLQTYTFEPSVIVDISDVFEKRMQAVTAYGSQFARSNQGDKIENADEPDTFLTQSGFYEWIEARARHYGMIIGAEFGEPFWTYEAVGTRDPFALVTKKVA